VVTILHTNYLFCVIKHCTSAVKVKINRKCYSHVLTRKNLVIYRYYECIYTYKYIHTK